MPPCERSGAPSWAARSVSDGLDLVAVAVHLEVDAPRRLERPENGRSS